MVQKNSPRMIAVHEKERQALELRKAGATFDEIADALGMSKNGVWKAVTRALKSMTAEPAEELRSLEVARLDTMQRGLWNDARKGKVAAVDRVIKISERRSKLLGLDAPTKAEVTGKDGAPINTGDPTPQLAASLIRQAFGEHALKNEIRDAGSGDDGAVPPRPAGG
jgi:DNA-binding CsgD family transcriptional regulator